MNTTLLHVGLMVVYISTSSTGLYLLKSAEGWRTPSFVVGAGLYGAGFVLWLLILKRLPLSLAFPVASGGLIIATQLFGFFLLSERISQTHLAGIILIIVGIALLHVELSA